MLVTAAGARVWERLRPWAAPSPSEGAPTVAVVGAGPAGLATAALLRRRDVRAVLFDRRPQVGGRWPSRYDSLRLNTVRWMSDLPGRRMPRRDGRWTGRDDVVRYLCEYARWHGLEARLGVEVESLAPGPDRTWHLSVDGVTERVAGVVVCTGNAAVASLPDWARRPADDRWLLHSSEYRRPRDLKGRRALVVGGGSSGGEIALDLERAGWDVVWSVRTAPHVVPREVRGVPTTPAGPLGDVLPARIVDALAPRVERALYGRRDYLPPTPRSLTELMADGKEPLTADGIVAAIREGRVRVAPAVATASAGTVHLDGGATIEPDVVIVATGYEPALDRLVGHLGVLGADGRPTGPIPRPGLGFVGFRVPLTGTLWAIEADARHVARHLLSGAPPPDRGDAT